MDERPQLLNVYKGDMSLIGPRPPTPDEVPHAVDETVFGPIVDSANQNPSPGWDRIAYNREADISARTIQRYGTSWD